MKVSVDAVTPTSRRVRVSFPATEITREFQDAYRSLNKVPLKGFRPGKTPRSVLTRYYGAKIADDIGDKLVEKTAGSALAECDYMPVSSVSFDRPKPVEGQDYSYSLSFHVVPVPRPVVTDGLATLGNLDLTPAPAEIEKEIFTLRQAAAERVPVEERGAELGDIVTINRTGLLNGVESETLAAEGVSVRLGGETQFPEITDALLGARVGDVRQVTINLPATLSSNSGASENPSETTDAAAPNENMDRAQLTLIITNVSSLDLPEIDDEFAKDFGFDGLQQLTAHLVDRVVSRKIAQARQGLRQQNLDRLLDMNPFPVPEEVVEQQAHANYHAAHPEQADSHDHTAEDLESHRALIVLRLRRDALIRELANQHNVTVGQAELDEALMEMTHQFSIAPEVAIKLMGGPERMYEYLHPRLLMDKTLDFLASGGHSAQTGGDPDENPVPSTEGTDNEPGAEVVE